MESLEPNSIFQNKMTFQPGDGLVKVGINNFNVVFALESLQIDLFNIVIIFQGHSLEFTKNFHIIYFQLQKLL